MTSEPAPVAKSAVKNKKPVAGLTLRLVDADTGEVLATAAEALEPKDPVTKKVLDLDTVKVGEFVADEVRGRVALELDSRSGPTTRRSAGATSRGC